ncbi:MAG: hypothetical protein ACTSUT_02030 [Promethearchaeota archaeon]
MDLWLFFLLNISCFKISYTLFSLVLELILVRRKVLYSIQLIVSFPLLFFYGLMFFISVACLPGVITFGLYLFLILLICMIIKIFTISKFYIESKKIGNNRRIKIKYLMKKKVCVELFEFGAFYENFSYIGLLQVLEASIRGWKYPKFHVRFTTTEFLARSFLLFADILLDLY